MSWLAILGLISLGAALGVVGFYILMMVTFLGVFR